MGFQTFYYSVSYKNGSKFLTLKRPPYIIGLVDPAKIVHLEAILFVIGITKESLFAHATSIIKRNAHQMSIHGS